MRKKFLIFNFPKWEIPLKFKILIANGFTLIELLVVISIIGILASLALASYNSAQKQARDTQRKSDLNQYRIALENYASANNGLYPILTYPNPIGNICPSPLNSKFISNCIDDPLSDRNYYYCSDDGTRYILYANLEKGGYWYLCYNGKTGEVSSSPNLNLCQ